MSNNSSDESHAIRAGDVSTSSATSGELDDEFASTDAGVQRGPDARAYRRTIANQRDEIQALREENMTLRAQQVEISALSVRLQQQFAATQTQVDSIKATIRTQLASPIDEKEFFRIESLPESDRTIVDTIKIGIYQQLGSLKAARDAAVRRGSELAADVEKLRGDHRLLETTAQDRDVLHANEISALKRKLAEAEQRAVGAAELAGRVADLQHRLGAATSDTERHLELKMELAAKTKEVMQLELQLREALGDAAAYKSDLRCSEEKLDVLKAEYYDMRVKFTEEALQLQNRLRVAEERAQMLADVELEAEVFIANVAQQQGDGLGGESGALTALPGSRRMQHAVTVTKRCLSLENQLAAAKADLLQKDLRIQRLEQSLTLAKSVLHGAAPYRLVEETVTALQRENEEQRMQLEACRAECSMLHDRLKVATADIATLSKHRAEMARIRDLLLQLGASPAIAPMINYERSVQGQSQLMPGAHEVSALSGRSVDASASVHFAPHGAPTAFGGHALEGVVCVPGCIEIA